MTALAARSGLLDSEFMEESSSSIVDMVVSVVSVVSTGTPRGSYSAGGGSPVPWVAVWALTTLGGHLLTYAVACGLMP